MNNIQSIQNFFSRLNIFKATLKGVTVDNLPLCSTCVTCRVLWRAISQMLSNPFWGRQRTSCKDSKHVFLPTYFAILFTCGEGFNYARSIQNNIYSLCQHDLYLLHNLMPFLIYLSDLSKWGIKLKTLSSTLKSYKKFNSCFISSNYFELEKLWVFYREIMKNPSLREGKPKLSPTQWYIHSSSILIQAKPTAQTLWVRRDFWEGHRFKKRNKEWG